MSLYIMFIVLIVHYNFFGGNDCLTLNEPQIVCIAVAFILEFFDTHYKWFSDMIQCFNCFRIMIITDIIILDRIYQLLSIFYGIISTIITCRTDEQQPNSKGDQWYAYQIQRRSMKGIATARP